MSAIQSKTNSEYWEHVRTQDNPADIISRGLLPAEFIKNKLWTRGPQRLSREEMNWPRLEPIDIEVPEKRLMITLVNTTDEAVLNSRPIIPLSSYPNDLTALSPAHFLICNSLTSISQYDLKDIQLNRLSLWQHIEKIRQHF